MGWQFVPWTFQYLLAIIIILPTSIYVLKKHVNSWAVRSFFLFGLSTALWAAFAFLSRNAPTPEVGEFMIRIASVFLFLSLPFALFMMLFLRQEKRWYLLVLVPMIALIAVVMTIDYEMVPSSYGLSYKLSPTPLGLIFVYGIIGGYLIGIMGIAIYLIRKTRITIFTKKQLLIVAAILLYFIGIFVTNYLLWKNPEFPSLGGVLAIIEFLVITYAITLPWERVGVAR